MPKGLIVMESAPRPGSATWAPDLPALAPVANRPLVLHALDTVQRAGAEEVVMVCDRRSAGRARAALGEEGAAMRWIETPGLLTSGDAVLAAAEFLEDDPFVLHVAEGLLVRDRQGAVRAATDADADATLFFTSRRLAGLHVLGPAVVDALRGMDGAPGGRDLSAAVDRLAALGGRVQAGELDSFWSYCPGAEDLLEVNRRVLDELEVADDAYENRDLAGVRIDGRVRIHPTATVRDAVLRGPAVIGAHARVTDAYVGPYSAIGDGATIDNAEIASSVVLPRARIRHVGVRVEDSIIGPGAEVARSFALPRAMRLLVGRDAQVTL